MMQATDLVLNMVLLMTFITFYGTIAWGLIRYSKRQGYRLWAIGWLVYTIGALQGGFASSPSGLAGQDLIAIVVMFIGSTLILDGARTSELTKKRIRFYIFGAAFFSALLILGLVFQLDFQYVFTPLGFYVAYVCIQVSRVAFGFESVGDNLSSKWWFILGLAIITASWLFFPITLLNFDLFQFFIIIQATGVIVTGSSMLTLFTATVTKDLENQYQISEVLSGLVEHDIRNYIQTARHALELTEFENVVENQWINIATEVLEDAGRFIDEMRNVSVSISKAEFPSEKTSLLTIAEKAAERVAKEYKITHEQVQIRIPTDAVIENSRLVHELIWNIFDNAFKHGSPSLLVQGKVMDPKGVELIISDRGSGLSEKVKAFLNSPDSLSKPNRPLVGLGILLIRGIASLQGISLHVSDNLEDMSVIGTTYHLKFNHVS
jgi:signal transduction histidine kinase